MLKDLRIRNKKNTSITTLPTGEPSAVTSKKHLVVDILGSRLFSEALAG
jgi:hypothetical protein